MSLSLFFYGSMSFRFRFRCRLRLRSGKAQNDAATDATLLAGPMQAQHLGQGIATCASEALRTGKTCTGNNEPVTGRPRMSATSFT